MSELARPPAEPLLREDVLEHVGNLWKHREVFSKAEAMGAPKGSKMDQEHVRLIERAVVASLYLECAKNLLIPVVLYKPLWTVSAWNGEDPQTIDPGAFEFPNALALVSCRVSADVIPALVP